MKCYVCLEECHETSPCECQTPIHEACMKQMQAKMPHVTCTICKTFIDSEYVEDDEEEDTDPCGCFCIFQCLCAVLPPLAFYILSGYAGKLLFFALGFDVEPFFECWTWEHACGSVVILCIVQMAISLLGIRTRIHG